ncbi:hypothetical protein JL101_035620 (plasmid) [Skermanella rosea]|uniref:hypothetical protein n=1 Tax=Skermanella rosea TaxID=1817965 RepID=UPI001932639B|nr:hypothetical protein [Skermanella rosea]UEM08128.1 hypothetical protein JL101_035620 [Skermanella rosea]
MRCMSRFILHLLLFLLVVALLAACSSTQDAPACRGEPFAINVPTQQTAGKP